MAFIPTREDDEQNKLQTLQQGIIAPATQGAQPVAQQQAPRGTTFTNLQKYIQANRPQAAQLGQQVAGQITSATEKATQQVQQKGEEIGQQIQSSGQRYDPSMVGRASNEELQSIASQEYKGPQQADIATAINPLTTQAIEKVKLAETTSGRTQLLKELAPTQRQTAGVLGLNQYLLSGTPEARSALDLAVQKAKSELPAFAQQEIAKRQGAVSAARQAMFDSANAARGEIGLRQQQAADLARRVEAEKQAEAKRVQERQAAQAAQEKQAWLQQQADIENQIKQRAAALAEQQARTRQTVQPQIETPLPPAVEPKVEVLPPAPTPVVEQPKVEVLPPTASPVVEQPKAEVLPPVVEQPATPGYTPKPAPVYTPPAALTKEETLALMGGKQNTSNRQVGDPRNPDIETDPKTWNPEYTGYWSDAQKYAYMKATGTQLALSPNVSNELAKRANQATQQHIAAQQATIEENTRLGTQAAAQQAAQEVAARMAAQQAAAQQAAEQRQAQLAQQATLSQVQPTLQTIPNTSAPSVSNQQVWDMAKQKYETATPEQILADAAKWDQITSEKGLNMTPQEVLERSLAYTARDQLKAYQSEQNRQYAQAKTAAEARARAAANPDRGLMGYVSDALGSIGMARNAATIGSLLLSDENAKTNVKKLTTFDVDKILGKYDNGKENS